MIRFIFVVLFVVLFLILSTPLMLVEWIIGKFNPGLKDKVPWPLSTGHSVR